VAVLAGAVEEDLLSDFLSFDQGRSASTPYSSATAAISRLQ